MADDRNYADLALALEAELQRERFRRELAEKTVEMLTDQLMDAVEEIRRLKGEP